MSDPFQGQRWLTLTSPSPRPFPTLLLPCPSSKYLSFYIASTLNIFIVFLLFFILRFSLNFLLGCTHTHTHNSEVCVCVYGLLCECVCGSTRTQDIVASVENVFNLIAPTFFATVPFGLLCFSAPVWHFLLSLDNCQRHVRSVSAPGRQDASRSRSPAAAERGVCPGMRNCRQR